MSCPETPFLVALFKAFKSNILDYCVLRNYDPLPENLGGSDLDLAVHPAQKEDLANVVISVAQEYGGRVVVDYTSSGRFIRLLGFHDGVWWGVAIDLFWMMEYRGVEYIPSSDVITRAVNYRGIKVARDDDAAVIALVKELLSNGKTRKNYFSDLAQIYSESGDDALHLLEHTFSRSTTQQLATVLHSGDDADDTIANLAKVLREDVFRSHGDRKLEGMFVNLLNRLRRVVKPAGVSVVVLGCDGSGKTTLINRITPVLERAIHNQLQYKHLRPGWLPALGVAIGVRKAGDGSPETNPHGQKASGFMGSLMRLGYYGVDYVMGYWLKVYPYLVKRPHICLFDRYYYDFLIDPHRMRIRLPNWLLCAVQHVVPKPSIILCLGADPELIYARKPETSLEEVRRQVDALKAFCGRQDRAYWVDTGSSPDKSAHEMLHLIRGAMNSRYH